MSNIYSLPTARFKTQVLKQDALSNLMTKLDAALTNKQFHAIRQNATKYKTMALRAKKVSKKQNVHELANELIRLIDIPVMTIEEKEKGEPFEVLFQLR